MTNSDSTFLAPFRKQAAWGYATRNRSIQIECQFDHAYPFISSGVAHVTKEGRSGLIRRDGSFALDLEYDWIGDQDEGWLRDPGGGILLVKNGRFGVANDEGEILVPPTLETPDAARRAAALAWQASGRPRPPQALRYVVAEVAERYDSTESYDYERAQVRRDGLSGFVNLDGEEVIPLQFEEAYGFDETGAAPVKKDGRFGHIDRDGNTVTPFEYDDAYSFVGETALVVRGGLTGLVRRSGGELVPCKYPELSDLKEDRAVVGQDGRYGYLDTTGEVAIPLEFESASNFQEGLGRVSRGGRWGLVASDGRLVVPLECEVPDWNSGTFPEPGDGRHAIRRNGCWGFVDSAGSEVVACKYHWAWGFRAGLARVAIPDPKAAKFTMPGGGPPQMFLFGWINCEGSEVIPPQYSLAKDFEGELARVTSAETTHTGYVDRAGTEYWED